MSKLIYNATIVNEGCVSRGHILIEGSRIAEIYKEEEQLPVADEKIDATGCLVIPGVIDSHVHFREPGLEHKADMESESRAAAYGGVTSYFDMPNTKPQTTTLEALEDKFQRAAGSSHVNYSFFFGATNDNVELLKALDRTRIPGIKLFMGSSTGNMLVDRDEALNALFSEAHDLNMPVMAHCEDTDIINANIKTYKEEAAGKTGEDVTDLPVEQHPLIRSSEACYTSSAKAVALAKKNDARLHIAHITTAEELTLIEPKDDNVSCTITAEVTPAHLMFCDKDYKTLGTRIKCNPAVKSVEDRNALRRALSDGTITTIGTDHAPHAISEKEGGALKAVSGMPMLQFSLPLMLSLVDEKIITIERMVELMSHNPARLFSVKERGFIRKGYKADLAIIKKGEPWTLTKDDIQSKCGWSPLEGRSFAWSVVHTICNGHHLLDNGFLDNEYRGEQIEFER